MKRAIITPTYSGHFTFVEKYLESLNKYLEDKSFPICIIISKSESTEFTNIIKLYKNSLNIRVYFLEDILIKFNIKETPDELMALYGRLSFQTIKKIYGALYIGAQQFLFLDSESLMIRATNMDLLFDEYFKHPKFFISKIDNRNKIYKSDFTYEFIRSITSLMNEKPEFYTTESYEWFYDLNILKDSIKKLGQPIDVIRNYNMPNTHPNLEGILEALWYYQYLLYNNKYGYKVYVVDDELKKYLNEEYPRFHADFNRHPVYACGVLECCTIFFDKNNVDGFIKFYNHFSLKIGRLEYPQNHQNAIYQQEFLKKTDLHILASNQNNILQVDKCEHLNKCNKHLAKEIRIFLYPFPKMLKWIFSIFNIMFYLIKILFIKYFLRKL